MGIFFVIFVSNYLVLRVIAKKILREFWEKHNDCEQQLKSWFKEASVAEWKNAHDIKSEYPSASIFNPNSAIEKKEYFSILISNCVAVEKIKR